MPVMNLPKDAATIMATLNPAPATPATATFTACR